MGISSMSTSQIDYRIRFERGESGLRAIAGDASVIVIVDVLSFSTAVDVALSVGASVRAARPNEDVATEAERLGAIRAVSRNEMSASAPYSLSPDSLSGLPPGSLLILPSPNGASLIACAEQFGRAAIIAGCLRNRTAIGRHIDAQFHGEIVAIVSAGERWPDGSLRPALEDDLGAGAILTCLDLGDASPEQRSQRKRSRLDSIASRRLSAPAPQLANCPGLDSVTMSSEHWRLIAAIRFRLLESMDFFP